MRVMNEDHPSCPLPDRPFALPYGAGGRSAHQMPIEI